MGALVDYSAYLPTAPRDDFELAQRVSEGLPLEVLDELKRKGFTFTELAEIIPPRTLKHRKAKGQRLSPEESERVLRVIRVVAFADRVFGEHEIAMRWLRRPSSRLAETSPFATLRTEAGGRYVEGMLWGISENVYQ